MPKLYMLTEHSPFMMSFLFVTDRNRAVIVDGGRPEDMPHLLEMVGDREIAAWILTHPHLDHISGFVSEMEKGEINHRVGKVYYNFPSEEFTVVQPSEELPHVIVDFNRIQPNFAEKCITVQPGLEINVDELHIEFLFCGEERYLYPKPNLAVNESSIAFKVTSPGMRSVLFLGDLGPEGGRDLLRWQGEKLKSDIVQMSHHGHSGVTEEVYRAIAPQACLWCAPDWLWEEEDVEFEPELWGTWHQRKWMYNMGVAEHYVSKDGTQQIPLEVKKVSIAKVYEQDGICAYCADRYSIFRPYPAKDGLLKTAKTGTFTLRAGKQGVTAFQIILAVPSDVTVTSVRGDGLSCINTGGADIHGNDFVRTQEIKAGRPWPLWCLLENPSQKDLQITVSLADGREVHFKIELEISEAFNSSLFDAQSLARLQWLNSREGVEDTLTKGYSPVAVEERTVKILGRDIRISEQGFIESIGTYFVGNNSRLEDSPREILTSPLEYEVWENGKKLQFSPQGLAVSCEGETRCSWQAENACGDLLLMIHGAVEFDGAVQYSAALKNGFGRNLSVRLVYTPRPEFAKYFMGLGLIGSKTPEKFFWRWDANKRQEAFWCGSMNGGVRIHPTAPDLERPLVNIYFHHSRNYMPECWVNGGKGYFSLGSGMMYYDSGEFKAENDKLFCADLMISPFKLVDMQSHWNTHFYHKNFNTPYTQEDVIDAVAAGCSHINVHHGNDTVPFLNYPMHDLPALKELADLAHDNGLGLKPYYTVRELTTRLPELFALRSLGTEIFPLPTYAQGGVPFHNGVDPFLTENFGDEVIPAWKHTFIGGKYDGTTDPTVATNPAGRICNFYVGSLAWLVENAGIDGLYIDDVGFDRQVMRRVRRVFDRRKPDAKIDFHTCNHFDDSPAIGFGYGHNMLIYMELLPYLDSLWVGEAYDYSNSTPEYILTEISGLPFGLMSEMLEGDCNVWRGMLYGMTSRYPFYKCYTGPSPVPVWQMRKSFEEAEMIGFWEEEQPVKADREDVFCTVYRDGERLLCCFANFAESEVSFRILGDLQGKMITAPEMENIQKAQTFPAGETITLPAKGGIMLIIE